MTGYSRHDWIVDCLWEKANALATLEGRGRYDQATGALPTPHRTELDYTVS